MVFGDWAGEMESLAPGIAEGAKALNLAPVHATRAPVIDARLGMHVLAALRAVPPSGIRAWAEVTAWRARGCRRAGHSSTSADQVLRCYTCGWGP